MNRETGNETVTLAQKSKHGRSQELPSSEAANHHGVFDSNSSELSDRLAPEVADTRAAVALSANTS